MHKIYHYADRSILSPPETDTTKFLALHGLTNKDVDMARQEDMTEDYSKTPGTIVKRILENYGQSPKINRRPSHVEDKPRSKTLATLLTLDQERQSKTPPTSAHPKDIPSNLTVNTTK